MWEDQQTPDRERKRMARLLLEDVTLMRDPEQITAHIRFKGGATQTIHVPVHRQSTDPRTVAAVQALLQDHHDNATVAKALNQMGIKTARGKVFTAQAVRHIVLHYPPSRHEGSGATAAGGTNPAVTGGAV
jgi:hypothetical protein